jgi:hypothetical protein
MYLKADLGGTLVVSHSLMAWRSRSVRMNCRKRRLRVAAASLRPSEVKKMLFS